MPKLVTSFPKYRKHRSSGQAVVTLNGRDHYLGPHKTKASLLEYDRLVGDWAASGRTLAADAESLTVVEIAAAFKRYAKDYYRDTEGKPGGRSYDRVRLAMKEMTVLHGRIPAAEFGPIALAAIQTRLADRGLSRSYVNDLVTVMRRAFEWATSKELLAPSIHQALATVINLRAGRSAAREPDPVAPVAAKVIDATLPFLSPVVADMIRLLRLTGCRPGEICAMRPCHVDRSKADWWYRLPKHKTAHLGRTRLVCIGPKARKILATYLDRAADAFCFQPAESEAKRLAIRSAKRETPLSYGNRPGTNRRSKPQRKPGARYSKDTLARAVSRACQAAGQPHWSPNQVRHSAGTEIRRRFGLEAAQVVLGHSKANVTEIYAERDMSLAVEVARKMG